MKNYGFEKHLISSCSPTLASLKTASLFSYRYANEESLANDLEQWNRILLEKGISIYMLRKNKKTALIYVCRLSRLESDLQRDGVGEFMGSCGYSDCNAHSAIIKLKKKLEQNSDFPHEIGIFLGYPLEDVKGFIENSGKNSKYTGYWKVYCDESEAKRTFAKYSKCREVYLRLWSQGRRNIMQLTVA